MMRKLTEAECRYAIEHGEFSKTVTGSARRTAVILTQSWCPQWGRMRSYLEAADSARAGEDIAILYAEYDREPWFEEFMAFKEDTFGNREVPYVRYYKDGALSGESNYLSADAFASRLT